MIRLEPRALPSAAWTWAAPFLALAITVLLGVMLFTAMGKDPVAALRRFAGPVIGAINGATITGGFELAMACDVLLASTRARFADTHARVGVMPGWGLSQVLPRLLGPYRAKELSLTGNFRSENWRLRPYRSPHHTASGVALVGGGNPPRPGEISQATHGVLFLDELPEFDRKALEVLREPMEAGRITISRAARQADFPARFQLIAAMNPCPCGYLGHPGGQCHCSPELVARYRGRISGPLLDRIDLHIEVAALPEAEMTAAGEGEPSAVVRQRVAAARAIQIARQGKANAQLGSKEIDQHCQPEAAAMALLRQAIARLNLSARAYHRILRVARSIADLAGDEAIRASQIAEAVQYRRGIHS